MRFWFKDKKEIKKEMTQTDKDKIADKLIKLEKIDGTVPKVTELVKQLRAKVLSLETELATVYADNDAKQVKINELEAILYALLNEDGGSMGGVV